MPDRKPAWWQLYGLVLIMVALLVAEQAAPLPGMSIQVATTAIVLLTFAIIFGWVQVNRPLLASDSSEREGERDIFHVAYYERGADDVDEQDDEPDKARLHTVSRESPETARQPLRRARGKPQNRSGQRITGR